MTKPLLFLVDDDPNDQELARIALESTGLELDIEVARDGKDALDKLERGELAAVRLVLLDLKLPKVNGLQVLKSIRAAPATRTLPVVVFTSSLEERDVRTSYDLGANGYLRKPVDFEEYSRAVSDLGKFWILRNELPTPR